MDTFERRDISTTAKMSFADKVTANEITKPTNWKQEDLNVSKMKINADCKDIPAFMGGLVKTEERKPKGYDEFTKLCDKNFHKIGLRK